MDNVEPVTCPECKRRYAAKFPACIYCKAPRPASAEPPPATPSAGAMKNSRPPPAAAVSNSKPPPAPLASRPPPAASRPPPGPRPGVGGSAARPVVVDDEAGSFPLGRIALGLLAVGAVASAVMVLVARHESEFTELVVLNTTGSSGVTVLVDGKLAVDNVPSTTVESTTSARTARLRRGPHRLEARDPGGAVIDSAQVDVTPGTAAILFVPKRAPELCFVVETAAYGINEAPQVDPLPSSHTLWELPQEIDGWFRPNLDASQVKVSEGQVKHLRAVRMHPCAELAPGTGKQALGGIVSAANALKWNARADAGAPPAPAVSP